MTAAIRSELGKSFLLPGKNGKNGNTVYTPPTIIAEPGRFYAGPAYTLVCRVISRRTRGIDKQNGKNTVGEPRDMLYQNDGIYGHFMNRVMEGTIYQPSLIPDEEENTGTTKVEGREGGPHRYTIWGPTCDGADLVAWDATLHCEALAGDWLWYGDMGGKHSYHGWDVCSDLM